MGRLLSLLVERRRPKSLLSAHELLSASSLKRCQRIGLGLGTHQRHEEAPALKVERCDLLPAGSMAAP